MKDRPVEELSLGELRIKFYGGVKEIGGNIILLEYKNTKIILDIGITLDKYNKFYEWPLRTPRGINEMISLGIVNYIDGLYVNWKDKEEYNNPETDIDAIFITHSHIDHIGLLNQVNLNINVYMGETCKLIEDIRSETRVTQPYTIKIVDRKNVYTFKTGCNNTFDIEDIKITGIHVDHSIPGAYSYIVETPEGNILYTGDYRLHGGVEEEISLTEDMIEAAIDKNIDLMITEGTRFHDISIENEIDVKNTLLEVFNKFSGPILIEHSPYDFDRIESIWLGILNSNRKLIMPDRYFIYLWNFVKYNRDLAQKLDIVSDKIQILSTAVTERAWRKTYYDIWRKEGYEIITYKRKNITVNQDYVLSGFTIYIQDLLNFKTQGNMMAIFSNSEPINEESEITYERILNWLTRLNIPSYRIHSSGHIHPLDLKDIVDRITPRYVYIIHSEYPDALSKFLGYDPLSKEKIG
jgi:ribonuclease J